MANTTSQIGELEAEFAGIALSAIRAGVPLRAVFERYFDKSGKPRASEGSDEYASLFRAAIRDTKTAALRHGIPQSAIHRWNAKPPGEVIVEAEKLLDGFDGWELGVDDG